ncbi:hypothetical protein C7212DRAFT_345642 [Tuber magnatum]|uniref:Uncharacterized protein n=1 Tax=Tuber magnatum TaxID=42249 RepID=A0A317SMX4_9PEZI|nr:hypothetical protein C7212DRAFT_345642 [Tuber magnatum]
MNSICILLCYFCAVNWPLAHLAGGGLGSIVSGPVVYVTFGYRGAGTVSTVYGPSIISSNGKRYPSPLPLSLSPLLPPSFPLTDHHLVKTQSRTNPPPDYPLAPQNRTSTTTTASGVSSRPTAVAKRSAQKSKAKISKALFKRHVEEVTREVMADLKGVAEGDGAMMEWEEEALELLRGVVEGLLEGGGRA